MFKKLVFCTFIVSAVLGYSEDRGLSKSGEMVIELSNTFGVDFETQQSGFSNNLYVYLAANLLDWDYFVKNEGSVKPAGYVVINGASLGFIKSHETNSSNGATPDGVDGSKDNHSVSWDSVSADSGWDRLEAGISMYPFFIEFFDEYGAPAPNFDWAGLESTLNRKEFDYDKLKPYGSERISAVDTVYEHTGGLEWGYLSRKIDLSLVGASRYDHTYVPDEDVMDTVEDYRNNYSFGGSFNLKKKLFNNLPLNIQGGVSGSNFSERQDYSFGGKASYDFKVGEKGNLLRPYIASDVAISTVYESEDEFEWEIASGLALLLSDKEEWKYNRAASGEYKYSSGNTSTTHWRRWHNSGNGYNGYPGVSISGRYVKLTDDEDASFDLMLQAWEFDGNEGFHDNLGASLQINLEDIKLDSNVDEIDILARLYLEYEMNDDLVRPYTWIDASRNTGEDFTLSMATGIGWKAIRNGIIDFRYESANLIESDLYEFDPGEFMVVTTITF